MKLLEARIDYTENQLPIDVLAQYILVVAACRSIYFAISRYCLGHCFLNFCAPPHLLLVRICEVDDWCVVVRNQDEIYR